MRAMRAWSGSSRRREAKFAEAVVSSSCSATTCQSYRALDLPPLARDSSSDDSVMGAMPPMPSASTYTWPSGHCATPHAVRQNGFVTRSRIPHRRTLQTQEEFDELYAQLQSNPRRDRISTIG